jgi:apolipoprotein N-acyltransferase
MRLPFTIDQFLQVFRRYNEAVWPVQWLLAAIGVIAVVLALRDEPRARRWVSVLLAVLWGWMAIVYHIAFFADLSRAGIVFGVAFGVQGALFSWLAVRKRVTSYRPRSVAAMGIGTVLMAYALILYPVLGSLWGHRYPTSPTFGVPCPTTIFTLGLIVWAGASIPHRLLIVPFAWAIVGTSAAAYLGMAEDFGLLGAAILTAGTLVGARHRGVIVNALQADR